MNKQQVKRAIAAAGLPLLDARIAWWRSGYSGFQVTQDTDSASKYITVTVRYPKDECEEQGVQVVKALADAGIIANYHIGIVYIDPAQDAPYERGSRKADGLSR